MIAIETKYLPATDTLGSRIKATANRNSITIPFGYEFDGARNYAQAAIALCQKMGWKGDLISGGTEKGYVFCFVGSEHFKTGVK